MENPLTDKESAAIWIRVAAAWDIRPVFYYPLEDTSSRRDLLALETSLFHAADGVNQLRRALGAHGVDRCWEFHEFKHLPTKRIAIREWSAIYAGTERFWTSEPLDWLLYLSHEESITLGGAWLVEAFKRTEPRWRELLWKAGDPQFVQRSA